MYRPDFDPTSVLLAVAQLEAIVKVDSVTLLDTLTEYKVQGCDVLIDTRAPS